MSKTRMLALFANFDEAIAAIASLAIFSMRFSTGMSRS